MSTLVDQCPTVEKFEKASPDRSRRRRCQAFSPSRASRPRHEDFTHRHELAQLLFRCTYGDRSAFERLYGQTSSRLFGLILRLVKDPDLASEILQESYLKIWTRAGEFHPDKAAPITWMSAIARHQAIDWIRRTARRPGNTEPTEILDSLIDEEKGPLEQTARIQQARQLNDWLEHLSENQRRAIILVYFNGFTHEELAHYLDKPLGTVKTWVRRGLLQLRENKAIE